MSKNGQNRSNAEQPRREKNVKNYLFIKNRLKMAQIRVKILRFFIFQIIFSNKSLKSSILPIFIQFE